ncbi:MAG: hypothetical protein KF794_06490 [Xanthobacteraceae bacterium]|nr:hypothetical protein [Xanthobacteraceae bacterium]QYK46317.1 MAG: hypothetical protein KF794_06490 [Xanthobacteraceae bacterium]
MRKTLVLAMLAASAVLLSVPAKASHINPYTYIFNDTRHPNFLGTRNLYPFPANPLHVRPYHHQRRWR